MKLLAEIELDISPETKEHAQHVLNNETRFRAFNIKVTEVVDNS